MDVAVKAGQDSMPAGMAKVLEILSSSLSAEPADGTLEVNSQHLVLDSNTNEAKLIVTYKNSDGLFTKDGISVTDSSQNLINSDQDGDNENVVYTLKNEGDYIVKAGKTTIKVNVTK